MHHEAGARPSYSELSILVADDQEHVRRWVRRVLSSMGAERVVEAEDGMAAMRLVTAPGERFDIILCDLKMPRLDGVELIRSMSAIGVQAGVIVMSVESERVLETSALLAEEQGLHVLGVVPKPVTAEKLAPLFDRAAGAPPAHRVPTTLPADELAAVLPTGGLHLVYQPRVAMATGRLTGVEALARWRHPDFGLIMPHQFVSACEQTPALGAWLLDATLNQAMTFAGRWNDGVEPINVAVNVHAGAFDDLDLPDRLVALAQHHGVAPGDITLEITERSVARNAVRMLDVATRIRLKGFGLAIDDFGTGHSGLAQLRRLPFNQLKIDREFVHGAADSPSRRSVVEASVSLARNLQMTSVAEGIQRRTEWDLLQSLGCEEMQGFFTARPMSEEGLQAWSAQWNLHVATPALRS